MEMIRTPMSGAIIDIGRDLGRRFVPMSRQQVPATVEREKELRDEKRPHQRQRAPRGEGFAQRLHEPLCNGAARIESIGASQSPL